MNKVKINYFNIDNIEMGSPNDNAQNYYYLLSGKSDTTIKIIEADYGTRKFIGTLKGETICHNDSGDSIKNQQDFLKHLKKNKCIHFDKMAYIEITDAKTKEIIDCVQSKEEFVESIERIA